MRRMKWLLVLGIVVWSASVAQGGNKITKYALIETIPGGLRGSGALGSVRSQLPNGSSGPMIWCEIDAGAGATGNMITCQVTDQNGAQANCALLDTTGSLTAAVAAMNGDSYLIFEVAVPPPPPPIDAGPDASVDASGGGNVPVPQGNAGMCTLLKIQNSSAYYPKT